MSMMCTVLLCSVFVIYRSRKTALLLCIQITKLFVLYKFLVVYHGNATMRREKMKLTAFYTISLLYLTEC